MSCLLLLCLVFSWNVFNIPQFRHHETHHISLRRGFLSKGIEAAKRERMDRFRFQDFFIQSSKSSKSRAIAFWIDKHNRNVFFKKNPSSTSMLSNSKSLPYYFTFWLSLLLVKHVHKAINLVFDEVRGCCKPCLHDLRYVEEMLKRAKIWNLYAFQVYERYLILESYLDFFLNSKS